MISLNEVALIYSSDDEIIAPAQSEWFSFFEWNTTEKVIPWREMPSFVEDWIGLATLYNDTKVQHDQTTCMHSENHLSPCNFFFSSLLFVLAFILNLFFLKKVNIISIIMQLLFLTTRLNKFSKIPCHFLLKVIEMVGVNGFV